MTEIDYAREASEWRRFGILMFRIGIALGVCLVTAVLYIGHLMWKGCA